MRSSEYSSDVLLACKILGKSRIEWAKKQQNKISSKMLQRFIPQNAMGWRLLFVEIEYLNTQLSQADHSTEQFAGSVLLKYKPFPGSPKTKLCPLVGSGILYMDHPKNQPLCLVLDFQGITKTIYSLQGTITYPTLRKIKKKSSTQTCQLGGDRLVRRRVYVYIYIYSLYINIYIYPESPSFTIILEGVKLIFQKEPPFLKWWQRLPGYMYIYIYFYFFFLSSFWWPEESWVRTLPNWVIYIYT